MTNKINVGGDIMKEVIIYSVCLYIGLHIIIFGIEKLVNNLEKNNIIKF